MIKLWMEGLTGNMVNAQKHRTMMKALCTTTLLDQNLPKGKSSVPTLKEFKGCT